MNEREALRAKLLALGFDAVRFVRADALPEAHLRRWLEAGHQADMAWMGRDPERRTDPRRVLSGARSLILLGVNYLSADHARDDHPRWARYAQYDDYHDTIRPALVEAGRVLEATLVLKPDGYRYYVDTGPVLEREWAARAGLGFVGKNAMLISRDFGNWLFLAAILVAADIEPDAPLRAPREGVGALCGKCTRCLDACPTQAFVGPGWLDARRCISYLTIENKGAIPREFRRAIGNRIYGCDVCAEVCPWNRFAQVSRSALLHARADLPAVELDALLRLDGAGFARLFKDSPIKRIKLHGLLRNACIVAANLGARECLDSLVALASHAHPLVRVHAVWTVRVVAGGEAETLLAAARASEVDAAVIAEYESTL